MKSGNGFASVDYESGRDSVIIKDLAQPELFNDSSIGSRIRAKGQQEGGGLFLLLSFIELYEKRQHFVRQILWNFIARPQLLSDRRVHGAAYHCFRPGHVIRFIA